jgi:hypothetical protein
VFELEEARDRARRARDGFIAVGGQLPDESTARNAGGFPCEDLYTASALCWWFAGQAELQGLGGEYVAYYSGLGEGFSLAGDACVAAS